MREFTDNAGERQTTGQQPRPPNLAQQTDRTATVLDQWILRYANEDSGQPLSSRPLCIMYFQDGKAERTQPIVHRGTEHSGNEFTTTSGERFCLGKPYGPYRRWLSRQGFQFDENNPLRFARNDESEPVMGPLRDPDSL